MKKAKVKKTKSKVVKMKRQKVAHVITLTTPIVMKMERENYIGDAADIFVDVTILAIYLDEYGSDIGVLTHGTYCYGPLLGEDYLELLEGNVVAGENK